MNKTQNTAAAGRRRIFLLAALLFLLGLTVNTQAAVTVGKASITKVKTVNSDTHRVYWKTVSKASGYQIAYKTGKAGKYKYILVKDGSATHGDVAKRLPNLNYYYRVRAYRTVKKARTYGAWSDVKKASINKEVAVYGKDVPYETYGRFFKSSSQSRKNMTTIEVKTWDFKSGKKGKKITITRKLTVNKKIASSLKRAFNEIYKDSGKFPIHYLGGWRWDGSRSEHGDGTAIDINPEENYQIRNGKILCGSHWKPKTDPYSIPKDGRVATILKKYGFTQGIWSSSQDYMHFSYFGT